MGYDICLFDLDGTLTDPKIGITKSVRYALAALGIDAPSLDDLTKFIGLPLRDSFRGYYGFSELDAENAVAKYREYFSDTGIFENMVYPGVSEMLQSLRNHRKTLAVATSKPTIYAKQILEHFGLSGYFTLITGSELDGTRSRKSEVIRYALDILDPQREKYAVMIGDREHDIIGTNEAGIDSIGVIYGYGTREELETAGANEVVDMVTELLKIL